MGRTPSSTAASGTTSPPNRRGHGNPIMLVILGLCMLAFTMLIVTLQTQTNEAYINGTPQAQESNINSAHPTEALTAQWSIWLQIPKLMFGSGIPGPDVTTDDLLGVIIGQGVELSYIAVITARGITAHSSQKLGKLIGMIAIVLLILLSIFDFLTDLVYGNASPGAHLFYAVFCTFVIGFFPTWGATLIEHGWKRL